MLFLLLWVLKSLPDCFSWKQKILDLIMSVDFLPSFLFFCLLELGDDEPFAAAEVFFSVSSIPIKRKSFSPLLSPIFTPLLCTQKAIAHIKGTFWRKFASLLDFLVIEYVLLVCGGAYFSGKVACIAEEDCLLIFLDMHSMRGLHAYSQLQSMGEKKKQFCILPV